MRCGRPPAAAPRANCWTDCSARIAGSTSGWRSTAFSSSAELYRELGPAAVSVAGGLRRAVCARRPARRWGASWRRTRCCSTPRRWSAKWSSRIDVYFAEGRRVPPAGRGLAGGAHAGADAVRRLRETGADLRPSAASSDDLRRLKNLPELFTAAIAKTGLTTGDVAARRLELRARAACSISEPLAPLPGMADRSAALVAGMPGTLPGCGAASRRGPALADVVAVGLQEPRPRCCRAR